MPGQTTQRQGAMTALVSADLDIQRRIRCPCAPWEAPLADMDDQDPPRRTSRWHGMRALWQVWVVPSASPDDTDDQLRGGSPSGRQVETAGGSRLHWKLEARTEGETETKWWHANGRLKGVREIQLGSKARGGKQGGSRVAALQRQGSTSV